MKTTATAGTSHKPITRQDIRVIAFDLDDTALNTKKEITPGVRAALVRAVEDGVAILPATGRQLNGIPPVVMELSGIAYALTANGARVYDLEKNTLVHEDTFPQNLALDVLARLQEYECLPSVYLDGKSYAEDLDVSALAGHVTPEILQYLATSRIPVASLAGLIRENETGVDKFSVNFADPAERLRALKELGQWNQVAVTSSIPSNLEVNTRTANKGAGLTALAKYLGVPLSQVMAVGDNSNDVEMLEQVGYSVAMCNGTPEARYAANAVTTKSCDEDGLAEAINTVLGLTPFSG